MAFISRGRKADDCGFQLAVLTDLYGFIGTVIAGIVIVTAGFNRADATASLVVVALMAKAAWELLRDSGCILLEAAPEDMDLEEVRAHLAEVPHVLALHDLHAWTVTSGLAALSAHVVIKDDCFNDGHAPACSTSSKPAWPATSTSSTPPSSSKPPPTPTMNPARTSPTRPGPASRLIPRLQRRAPAGAARPIPAQMASPGAARGHR